MNGWLMVAGDFVRHGGMDRANFELARFLAAGAPVHLVTHRAAEKLRAHPNITVHQVRRPFGKHLLGQPLLASSGRRWASRLAREGFRVVVNGGNCRWPDANWVHYVHAAQPRPTSSGALRSVAARIGRAIDLRTERTNLTAARVVLCNSNKAARDVVELVGVKPDRVRVVYLGSDPEQFPPVGPGEQTAARRRLGWDQRPWAVFVGALGETHRKGFDTLYLSWKELCRASTWDVNLAVVGTGRSLAHWRERAAGDGLSDRIHFLGFRTDVPEVLAAADLMVHPARYEPYGLGVHEAICRGLPVIVSASAGVTERLSSELAELILNDPNSPAELADRLRHWRANTAEFVRRVRPLGDALRARTWAQMAGEIRDIILATS